MHNKDQQWWQQKYDESSGFHSTNSYDSRLMTHQTRRKSRRKSKGGSLWLVVLTGMIMIAVAGVLQWAPH
ncbi:hypothetical protein [Aquabacterium sp.]|uniref:hypothetical protein n=1 Tax=Aquabacterium sp. TaxID=1872578 RepID=UPI003B6CE0EB